MIENEKKRPQHEAPLIGVPAESSPEVKPAPPADIPVTNKRRSKLLWYFTLVLIVIALGWFLLWYFYLEYRVTTDDAYANGNQIDINAVINGSVIAFYADNTDLVVEGQLLAQLDTIYYQTIYDKALASLAAQAMQIKQLYDDAQANQANVNIYKSSLSKAKFDYENRSLLVGSKAISNEDFIHSRDALTIAENELQKAESQLKASLDLLGEDPLEMHPLLEEKKAELREAFYQLKHCNIYAPTTGYIAQRAVNVGQSVSRTTHLMSIIPANYVWVDANFKETQLTYMRVGQPATVWFDMYGSSVQFKGKVLGIASGTGSIFSLIPPQNATGNWIKIVQRVPVRISLDPEVVHKYPIRLGVSAEVEVDITDQDLPMLTQVPSSKTVAVTDVFNINLDEVNQAIQQVMEKYFR